MIKLSVNIDHFATLRNARGEENPSLLRAARVCQETEVVSSITCHLREDRRHILDDDIYQLVKKKILPLNFEMAVTDEMLKIAIEIQPYSICLVPEKRQELTTESGLILKNDYEKVKKAIKLLRKKTNSIISLFVDSNVESANLASKLDAHAIEIHCGHYALAMNKVFPDSLIPMDNEQEDYRKLAEIELNKIIATNVEAKKLNLLCNAGHGIAYDTAYILAKNCSLDEMSIGHFLVSESLFHGFDTAIKKIYSQMQKGYDDRSNSKT